MVIFQVELVITFEVLTQMTMGCPDLKSTVLGINFMYKSLLSYCNSHALLKRKLCVARFVYGKSIQHFGDFPIFGRLSSLLRSISRESFIASTWGV